MAWEVFDQKYWLNKQEEKDFLKTWSIDKIKEEVKWDLQKLEDTVIKNYHTENYDKVSNAKIDQIKNVVGKDFYDKNLKLKTGGAEWIAALQILAMKCVNIMNINGNNKLVEAMLKNEYINSWAVDGILGPNTLFVLKEISKTELWWVAMTDWNWIVNEELLTKMLNICWEPPVKPEEPPVIPPVNPEEPPVNPPVNPEEPPVNPPVNPEEPPVNPPVNPEEPPVNPPVNPEEPPVIPPVNPEEPPVNPPVNPEEPPVIPPVNPEKPPVDDKELDKLKISLRDSFSVLALKYSADGYAFDKNPKKSTDWEKEYYSIIKNGVIVMDIWIFVSWNDKWKTYVWLWNYIHEKSNVWQEIDFTALDDKKEFENIINEIKIATTPVNPEEPPVNPPVNPEEPPVKPPVNPEEPPVNPPVNPEEPPVNPPVNPEEPPVNPPVNPEKPPVNPPVNPEKLNLDWFDNEHLKNILRWKLSWIKLDALIARVLDIKNNEVRKKIEEYLLKWDIKWMQEKYLGMKVWSRYDNNRADGMLGNLTLTRMTNPMFWLKWKDIQDNYNIASDVKSKYKEFLDNNLNNNLSFAIISKSDFNMYIFSADHRLLGIHPVLLGKDKWDQENTAYVKNNRVKTTPGGMYYIPENIKNPWSKAGKFAPHKYAYPGEYVALYPEEGQYNTNNPDDFTLWFHNYYLWKNRDWIRKELFSEAVLSKRRVSSWCINTLSDWIIYDNLLWKSKVYITKESN